MKLLWLRWLGVIPASIFAFVLSTQVLRLIYPIGPAVSREILAGTLIWNALFPFMSYVTLTLVGMRVAPSHQRLVGILLSLLGLGLVAFQMTGLLVDYGYSPWHSVFFGAAIAGMIVGSFQGVSLSKSH